MRKSPIKHRVKTHKRKTDDGATVVHQHVRGSRNRTKSIAKPTVRVQRSFEDRAWDAIVDAQVANGRTRDLQSDSNNRMTKWAVEYFKSGKSPTEADAVWSAVFDETQSSNKATEAMNMFMQHSRK